MTARHQVIMTAKLSKGGYKGKWYQRNETIMLDIKVPPD